MRVKTVSIREAFLAPANLLALSGAAGASIVTHDPSAALVALGLEAVYLVVVEPLRALAARRPKAGRTLGDVSALLDELSPSQRDHYLSLRELRDRIEANYRKLPGGRVLAASSEQRVDALLTAFLRMLGTLNAYRTYLHVADRSALETELAELGAEVAAEEPGRLREVKRRRAEILQKRLERFRQAEESREVVSHQLAGIEDLLRLTHEQSIAMRDPESVEHQLRVLSSELAATEETVREMERFLDFTEETSPVLSHGSRVRG